MAPKTRLEPGITIRHGNFLAVDGTYGSKHAAAVVFRVRDGAIATFYRCDLSRSRATTEAVIAHASTAILVECTLPAKAVKAAWTAEPDGSQLVLVASVPKAAAKPAKKPPAKTAKKKTTTKTKRAK